MTKPSGTLPKLPRTLVDDAEEVSWALDIARGLVKQKEFEGALVWLRRAAQSAAIAEADDRAVELADAAKLLGGWIRCADQAESGAGAVEGKRRLKPEPVLPRRRQRSASSVPAALATPAGAAQSKLPAKSTRAKSIAPLPQTPAKKSVRPPAPKSVKPPLPKSIKPARPKTEPPSKLVKPARPSTQPPARKSMRPPQRTLLFSDLLPTANDPDEALVTESIRSIPAFGKLSKGKKLALTHAAELVRLSCGDEVSVTGLLFVAQGEVRISAAVSDCSPVTLLRGQALRGQSSLGVPLALRCSAHGEDAVVLRWTVGELAEALVDSRAIDDELRELADPVQAACGATLGTLAESIGEDVLRVLLQKMQLKRLAPGEVWVEQGKPMPGVCLLGLGKLQAGTLQDYGPGDVPFAESALACEPLELPLTAGAKGALLWVGTRAALFELLTSAPTLLESLTSQ